MNSGNALIQHLSEKMQFSCFPVLPGSAEVQVIWDGTIKRLLIAYFIGNISAKKISKCIHVCQSYSKSMVGRFSTAASGKLYRGMAAFRDSRKPSL